MITQPTPALASDQLTALSTAVADVFWDRCGCEPSEVRTLHFDEHVIAILEGGPAPLPRNGIGADLMEAAERVLGREVLRHSSSLHPESEVSFEMFLLGKAYADG
jgi:hypothetical protein